MAATKKDFVPTKVEEKVKVVKTETKETPVVVSEFDASIPESKQRHLR